MQSVPCLKPGCVLNVAFTPEERIKFPKGEITYLLTYYTLSGTLHGDTEA